MNMGPADLRRLKLTSAIRISLLNPDWVTVQMNFEFHMHWSHATVNPKADLGSDTIGKFIKTLIQDECYV